MILTASDIVQAIGKLPTNRSYNYIEKATTTKIQLVDVVRPEGPIKLKRWNPNKGEGVEDAVEANISAKMLLRVANAARPGQLLNIDRILGASYNTRSALETLLAHTPDFYVCYPGRIEISTSTTAIKQGHKHLLWLPSEPHEQGVICQRKTEMVISEMPGVETVYESLELPEPEQGQGGKLDIELARRHAQIQVALVMIGRQLGFRTWVARNDKGIKYGDKRLGEIDGVVGELDGEALIAPHRGAIHAALLIDCIWFRNAKFMPAVIEIEHTTGVTSGLSRMKNLQDSLPPFYTRWVVAAPDEARDKVMQEANKPMFQPLKTWFFPYSAIEELYSLCRRRNITGRSVNEAFLESFMEACLKEAA
jgi:type II restriction enzyme